MARNMAMSTGSTPIRTEELAEPDTPLSKTAQQKMEPIDPISSASNLKYLDHPEATDGKAARAVLGTPELLEMILLGLPIQDLLVNAQMISKFWKEAIEGSLQLQRLLFFLPWPQECPPVITDSRGGMKWWSFGDEDPHDYIMSFKGHGSLPSLEREAMKRPEASWRRMLHWQPLVKLPEGEIRRGPNLLSQRYRAFDYWVLRTLIRRPVHIWNVPHLTDEFTFYRFAKLR